MRVFLGLMAACAMAGPLMIIGMIGMFAMGLQWTMQPGQIETWRTVWVIWGWAALVVAVGSAWTAYSWMRGGYWPPVVLLAAIFTFVSVLLILSIPSHSALGGSCEDGNRRSCAAWNATPFQMIVRMDKVSS